MTSSIADQPGIAPKWYTTKQVAIMLGYSLTKTKHLILSGQIRSVKDGGNRRILPAWVDEYVAAEGTGGQQVSKRGNNEGSLYQSGDGWRGYIWCTRPDGTRYRKYVRGKTYEEPGRTGRTCETRRARGPVSSDVPRLAEFLGYWLKDIVEPNLAPKTYEKYEMFSRLHIIPHLGGKRLDTIQVKDIRQWLNKLTALCQCCAQGKDASRPEEKRDAARSGNAVTKRYQHRSRKDARDTLRAALDVRSRRRDNYP